MNYNVQTLNRDQKFPVTLCIFTEIAIHKANADSFTSWLETVDFILSTAAITAAANTEKTTTSQGLIAKVMLNSSPPATVNVRLSSMFLGGIIKGVSLAILDMIIK